jgi:hypothetical protein
MNKLKSKNILIILLIIAISFITSNYMNNSNIKKREIYSDQLDPEYIIRSCAEVDLKYIDKSNIKNKYYLSRIFQKKLNANWVYTQTETVQNKDRLFYYFYVEHDNFTYIKVDRYKVLQVYDVNKKIILFDNANKKSNYSIYHNINHSKKFIFKTFDKKLKLLNCI